jgi:hypothetical protein
VRRVVHVALADPEDGTRSEARRRRVHAGLARRFTARGLAIAVVATSAVVLGSPGVAMASCGTHGSGQAGYEGTLNGHHFPSGEGWTMWRKQPPGCHDFNLTYVTDHGENGGWDDYAGWYAANGNIYSDWHEGASGYHYLVNGSYNDVAIVTNVGTGAYLAVTSAHATLNSLHVDY